MDDCTKVIIDQYVENKEIYEFLIKTVSRIISELLFKEKIPYSSISCRVKEHSSLINKIEKKNGKYEHIDNITDIVGIRIITFYSDDVDKIADLIKREFKIDFENSIDKREVLDPDRFGYLSLHYVCEMSDKRISLPEYSNLHNFKFEIQIRSILQHTWAEIEHDLGYKNDIGIPRDIRRNFSRLAGLLELADKEFAEIRDKLQQYEEEVKEQLEEDKDMDILIDDVSIRAFLNSNEEIKNLNLKISEIAKRPIKESANLNHIVKSLSWFNFKTIHDVANMLESNKDLAIELASKFLNGSISEISNIIGIWYLCYAELLIKKYSDKQILDYLSQNNAGPGSKHSTLEQLKKSYTEITK